MRTENCAGVLECPGRFLCTAETETMTKSADLRVHFYRFSSVSIFMSPQLLFCFLFFFFGKKGEGPCRKRANLLPTRAPRIYFPHHKNLQIEQTVDQSLPRVRSPISFCCSLFNVSMCFNILSNFMCFNAFSLSCAFFTFFHFLSCFSCVLLSFFVLLSVVLLLSRVLFVHIPSSLLPAYRTSSGNGYCNSFAWENKKKTQLIIVDEKVMQLCTEQIRSFIPNPMMQE